MGGSLSVGCEDGSERVGGSLSGGCEGESERGDSGASCLTSRGFSLTATLVGNVLEAGRGSSLLVIACDTTAKVLLVL